MLLRAEAMADEVNRSTLTIKDALDSFANTRILYRLPLLHPRQAISRRRRPQLDLSA